MPTHTCSGLVEPEGPQRPSWRREAENRATELGNVLRPRHLYAVMVLGNVPRPQHLYAVMALGNVPRPRHLYVVMALGNVPRPRHLK